MKIEPGIGALVGGDSYWLRDSIGVLWVGEYAGEVIGGWDLTGMTWLPDCYFDGWTVLARIEPPAPPRNQTEAA